MISLHRDRSSQAIAAKYRGVKKLAQDLVLLQAQREVLRGTMAQHTFLATYWKTAKSQLKKESNGKCAYCEATTDIVAHGDVEHYRPKGIYWWLAYTYDNYLYACQICNQVYKSDHFPLPGTTRLPAPAVTAQLSDAELAQLAGFLSPDPLGGATSYSLSQYAQAHRQERALLLDPYADDPAQYFAYEADAVMQEVMLVAATPHYQAHLQAAEDYYGLNRVELKSNRYKVYKLFQLLRRSLAATTDAQLQRDIQQQLLDMQADDYLFAGMNRYFARQPIKA
ncbi:hypothetical protein GCM10023172_42440 [Hymenobacter ginsengisoli]|uniref:TIGR02646 family protein n=1 Tax=Hymenobacter ginsengisoli TaxID=1051626 RepID=A0ABP8QR52_9BACT|nr:MULTISPECIES: hypothetical protein [unclassified Hymenobacter]MBO2033404.1 hypothetical protein [Hymenobacter sp. BT559]